MDKALVEDPQHDIDYDQSKDEQEPETFERRLKRLRGTLKRRGDGGFAKHVTGRAFNLGYRLAERDVGL